MTEWLLLALALLLIAANGVFVAAEFSLITADRSTVERRAEAGDGRAQSLLAALRSLSTQLSGAQLGITVTSLVVGFIAEPSLATLLRGPLGLTGLPDGAVTGLALGLALLLATAFQMIFGELVPKNWAIAEPLRVGRVVAGPQRGFTAATRPLISVLNGSANRILRLFGITPTEELASARAPQELVSLVSRSGREGTLDRATAELVARSISFGDRTAADVMTARPRARFLASSDPVTAVIDAAVATGHSRFPVIGADLDDVVGVAHVKHAVAVGPDQRGRRTVAEMMATIPAVPETMELDPLLEILRRPGLQMAVVVDEYGGTAGIVSLEDLVEEIVGEIADEQDDPLRRLRREPDGSWLLSGLLRPDEIGSELDLELPESATTDTIAGLVTERLGRLPEPGNCVTVPVRDRRSTDDDGLPTHAQIELTVVRLDGHRVDVLRLRRQGATAVSRIAADTEEENGHG